MKEDDGCHQRTLMATLGPAEHREAQDQCGEHGNGADDSEAGSTLVYGRARRSRASRAPQGRARGCRRRGSPTRIPRTRPSSARAHAASMHPPARHEGVASHHRAWVACDETGQKRGEQPVDSAENRGSRRQTRAMDAEPFSAQKVPKLTSSMPTNILSEFSGTPES